MTSKAKFGASLLAIGIGGIIVMQVVGSGKSDQELIQAALTEAIQAGKEGRPGSVLEHLSDSFEITGLNIPNRSQIAKFINDNRPNVEVTSTVAQVSGDAAQIITPIKISMSGPIKVGTTIPDVKIEFEKEHTTRFLVFPDRKWRMTRVSVPISSWSNLIGF